MLPNFSPLLEEAAKLKLLADFLERNKGDIAKVVDSTRIKATVVPDEQQYLPEMGQMIRAGRLVAFATETVYGLGADATNESALLEIYKVKKRPLSDPIIVHVLDAEQALKLVKIQSQTDLQLFQQLTHQFWPGPLTIILKANLDILPAVVTAQTGFVGVRSPKAPTARKLIEESQRPIGAPSANLFSHVSPTSAVHVFNDFYDQEVAIIEGEVCEYGVESTVVKIVDGHLEILREGSFSTKKLTEFVDRKFDSRVRVAIKKKMQNKEENENMEAPGQLLKHYAPYLPCFYLEPTSLAQSITCEILGSQNDKIPLSCATLISFSADFSKFFHQFQYVLEVGQDSNEPKLQEMEEEDKFCTAEEKKQMRCLYWLLRKAENLDTQAILIGWNEARLGTVWDKIFRATQGTEATLL